MVLRQERSFGLLFGAGPLGGRRPDPARRARLRRPGPRLGTDLGLVLAAGGIPFALFAIAGGVVADRVGRAPRHGRLGFVRAVVQAVTATLLLTGTAEVWQLVILSAIYGTAAAVFVPALGGLIRRRSAPTACRRPTRCSL